MRTALAALASGSAPVPY
ncbi:hypothetical protein [Sphingomonas nostoxanthinifaciens]